MMLQRISKYWKQIAAGVGAGLLISTLSFFCGKSCGKTHIKNNDVLLQTSIRSNGRNVRLQISNRNIKNVNFNTDSYLTSKDNNKPIGLYNMRNACYLNAAMQQLCNIESIKEIILSDSNEENNAMKKNLKLLIQKIDNQRNQGKFSPIVPKEYRKFGSYQENENYYNGGQKDSSEIMMQMLDCFSQANGLLKYTIENTKKCDTCNNEEKFGSGDSSSQLLLCVTRQNIQGSSNLLTVQEAIKNALLDKRQIRCNTCNTDKDHSVTGKFTQLPNNLILKVNRCSISETISDLTLDEKITLQENGMDVTYLLKGIVAYGGNGESGHYWSYVKNASDKWYRVNEREVTSMNFQSVQLATVRTSDILFYERSSNDKCIQTEQLINESTNGSPCNYIVKYNPQKEASYISKTANELLNETTQVLLNSNKVTSIKINFNSKQFNGSIVVDSSNVLKLMNLYLKDENSSNIVKCNPLHYENFKSVHYKCILSNGSNVNFINKQSTDSVLLNDLSDSMINKNTVNMLCTHIVKCDPQKETFSIDENLKSINQLTGNILLNNYVPICTKPISTDNNVEFTENKLY